MAPQVKQPRSGVIVKAYMCKPTCAGLWKAAPLCYCSDGCVNNAIDACMCAQKAMLVPGDPCVWKAVSLETVQTRYAGSTPRGDKPTGPVAYSIS